jgi:hypothetical protein
MSKRLRLSVRRLRRFLQPGLYRHFDEHGRLLYVGQTDNCLARSADHLREAVWRDKIHTIELEPMPKAQAWALERKIALKEMSLFNTIGGRSAFSVAAEAQKKAVNESVAFETRIVRPTGGAR